MNEKIIIIALVLLTTITIASAESSDISDYKTKIKGILPAGWEISKISEEAVPYNLTLLKNEKLGISFDLTGQTLVLDPRGINKEKESFTIWIMSKEYSGTESETQAQFLAAQMLGSNEKISVYVNSFVSDIPSWKNWKEDLIKLFNINLVARDPIGSLAAELSNSPLWQNGEFPSIKLPETAKHSEVIEECFKMTGFDRGHVKEYKIIRIEKVKIRGSLPDDYIAALVDTDLGKKIVLFQYTSSATGWWTRVYDSK